MDSQEKLFGHTLTISNMHENVQRSKGKRVLPIPWRLLGPCPASFKVAGIKLVTRADKRWMYHLPARKQGGFPSRERCIAWILKSEPHPRGVMGIENSSRHRARPRTPLR